MSRKEVTIYDIATVVGVSAATISRGLKNHPSISKETCNKIQQTAREMGYRSNALASSLRTRRSHTLGVIVPRLNSNFMSTILAGMEEAAVKAGYHLIIMQSFESKTKEAECAHLLFNHRVDGLLVSTTGLSDETDHFKPFFRKNIPVLFFDRAPTASDKYNTVTIDNYKAGYAVTNHLLENGCKNILHITGDTQISVYKRRLEGFIAALNDKGIHYSPSMVWTSGLGVEEGKKIASRILKTDSKPDAIFVANDICALTIIHSLKQHNIQIPQQIQIAGFNNDPFSSLMTPGLTTVDYPGQQMGMESVEAMVGKLNEPQPKDSIIHKKLHFELIYRQSSQSETLKIVEL